jgi:hypothetical protein
MGPSGIISLDSFGDLGGAGAGGADTDAGGGYDTGSGGGGFSGRSVSEMGGGRKADQEYDKRMANERAKLQMAERKQAERLGYDERENIADYGSADDLQRLYMRGVPESNLPGFFGVGLNALTPFRNFSLRKNIDFFRNDARTRKAREKYGLTEQGYKDYMSARLSGEIDAAGNPISRFDDDSNDNQILFPQDMEDNTGGGGGGSDDADDEDDTNTGGLGLRFRKDGGRINAMDGGMMSPEGGIMDLETGRQMYFLGKLVKKATRAVKKIVKSPIGKAAILGGAMYFGGGAGAGKLGSFFGKGSFNPLKALITKGPHGS